MKRGCARVESHYGRPMLGRKLQNWLDSHGLGAIALAIVAIAFVLSMILVVGGYFIVS